MQYIENHPVQYSFHVDLDAAAAGCASISTDSVIEGCIGVMDGYLLSIKAHNSEETGNVKAYFSGHYHTHGINIQAACDHHCRFISVCAAALGCTADITPIKGLL